MKFVLEEVIRPEDTESNDSGWNRSALLSVVDVPLWVEIHSNYPDGDPAEWGVESISLAQHVELASLVGKRVRVTIEVLDP